jgi:putative oxidoreductase
LPRLSGVGRLFEIRREFPRSTIRIDAALLALRLARGSGTTVAAILSGMFGGAGPKRFVGDHRLPVSVGYLVRLVQVVSAIGVLLGIFIRLAAVALMVVMLGAILLVHLPHGFDVSNGGMEYALTQLLIAFALLLVGAGTYSLSSRLPTGRQRL